MNKKEGENHIHMMGGAVVHKVISEIEDRMAAGEEFSALASSDEEREALKTVRKQNAASTEREREQ